MVDLPTGTVTFLYTDIEGSTRRWEAQPQAMRVALARHDAVLRGAIGTHGGRVFRTMGDVGQSHLNDRSGRGSWLGRRHPSRP